MQYPLLELEQNPVTYTYQLSQVAEFADVEINVNTGRATFYDLITEKM